VRYAVYCDESRHSEGPGAKYAVIGGLWIDAEYRDAFSRQIKGLRKDGKITGEVKWSKVSRLKQDAYLSLIEAFFANEHAYFRAIIVNQNSVDYDRHEGDKELGFYKFYYEMLEKWILPGNSYTILLDFKNNQKTGRLTALKKCLYNYGAVRDAIIHELAPIDSEQSQIAQLCDLLTGAVAADANGIKYGTAKHSFVDALTKHRGRAPLSAPSWSPAVSKFNVFRIALGGKN